MGQSFYILSLVKVIISDSNRIISAQTVMDFQPFIDEYKEGDAVSSPIWIWFIFHYKNGNISSSDDEE